MKSVSISGVVTQLKQRIKFRSRNCVFAEFLVRRFKKAWCSWIKPIKETFFKEQVGQECFYYDSLRAVSLPVRDSRGKRTSEGGANIACRVKTWVRACRPASVLHQRLDTCVTFKRGRRCSRPLACSFPQSRTQSPQASWLSLPSTIPERKERLLVVYYYEEVTWVVSVYFQTVASVVACEYVSCYLVAASRPDAE